LTLVCQGVVLKLFNSRGKFSGIGVFRRLIFVHLSDLA
jgi:hypothetical protein